MSLLAEKGTWTGNNSAAQTITLANGSLTPKAIICWSTGPGSAGSFQAGTRFSIGFATRRGGSTQEKCIGIFDADNVSTSDNSRVRHSELLHLLSSASATDYTITLDSFGAGQFVVGYSSASNANGDIFHYLVFGGDDITDANVIDWTMDATTGTEVITGVGFQSSVMFAIDADLSADNTITANANWGFGVASSPSEERSVAENMTDGDTMTTTMNYNRSQLQSVLHRLTVNADTQDAEWNLASFDSDGATLTVVDGPATTTRIASFLFIQGGAWEVGSQGSITGTGDDTFLLTNKRLTPKGALMWTNNFDFTIGSGNRFCLGAATSTDGAQEGVGGYVVAEAINTQSDRFHATDRAIEILTTSGGTPAETAEADMSAFNLGNFVLNWASAPGSSFVINFVAFGEQKLAVSPVLQAVKRAGHF